MYERCKPTPTFEELKHNLHLTLEGRKGIKSHRDTKKGITRWKCKAGGKGVGNVSQGGWHQDSDAENEEKQ
jgi:hypothetical protein